MAAAPDPRAVALRAGLQALGQRLGSAIEHQQADQQQESFRHALSVNHARPVHQDGHILAGNGGWGKPG